jgi:hypothetical protein
VLDAEVAVLPMIEAARPCYRRHHVRVDREQADLAGVASLDLAEEDR